MSKVTTKILKEVFFRMAGNVRFQTALAITAMGILWFMFREKTAVLHDGFLHTVRQNAFLIPLSIFMAAANWGVRILKWKILASSIRSVSTKEAAYQMLSTFSWSFFTPMNSGEFFRKPFFYKNKKIAAKQVMWEQISQMAATLLFGIPALAVFLTDNFRFAWLLVPVAVAQILLVFFLKTENRFRIWFLSIFRYIIFSSQLGLLLYFFAEKHIPVHLLLGAVPAYYLANSLLPLMPWVDLPVKSSLGLWIFTRAGIPSAGILTAILWAWILNVFLPALVGQYLIIKPLFGKFKRPYV
jgi:hypothetical protein